MTFKWKRDGRVRHADVVEAMPARVRIEAWLLPLLAAAGMLLLYWRTMAPTVYGLDSAELTAGAYLLGIVHAPGAPTYLLLGHVFTWLPFGDVGYRVNLLSAGAAAVAAGFLCAIFGDLLGDRRRALVAACYVATTYYIWGSALAAEIYALHLCIVAALIWLGLRWRRDGDLTVVSAFCLLFGLGLGTHLSLSVLVPGFAVLVADERLSAWTRPVLRRAAVCGALGVAVYLYLPLRAAADVSLNYARDFGIDVRTWDGFWWMVSGQMFASQMFGVGLAQLPHEVLRYFYQLWSNFHGLGFILGVLGCWTQWRRAFSVALAFTAMWVGNVAFVVTYDVADKDTMLATTFLLWGIWVALGVEAATHWIKEWTLGRVVVPATFLLLLMAAANVALNYRRVDISDDWSARQRGEAVLGCLPESSLYLANWTDASILDYLQHVEQQRSDVSMVNVFLVREERRQQRIRQHLASGLPVYAQDADSALESVWLSEYVEACGLFRVSDRPTLQTLPVPCAPAIMH